VAQVSGAVALGRTRASAHVAQESGARIRAASGRALDLAWLELGGDGGRKDGGGCKGEESEDRAVGFNSIPFLICASTA